MKNIILIGFMGSGKSSAGKMLARRLGMEFVDTDELIESREQMKIAEIFERKGETTFRALESQVLTELLDRENLVVSTGGGLAAHPGNLENMLARAPVVYLHVSPERAHERTKGHGHRPLLNVAEPLEKIRDLMASREPFYRQAHYIIDTDSKSAGQVADEILKVMGL